MKSRRLNDSEDSLTSSINGRESSLLIPMDLIIEIFSWLPEKTIAKFRFLSKLWASILQLPYFTELFLTKSFCRPQLLIACQEGNKVLFFSSPQPRYPDKNSPALVANYLTHFDCSSREILGPINGFVFIRRHQRLNNRKPPVSVSVICNPTTGQSLFLPKMKTRRIYGLYSFFAYDPLEKNFKVLSMTWLVNGRNKIFEEYQVLTVGTRKPSWRMIKCCIPHFSSHKGICINGVLYYTAAANTDSLVSMIVCFDVRSEKFRFIQLVEKFRYGTLINYKGKLGSLVSEGSASCYVTRRSRRIMLCILEDVEKQEWSEHIYVLPVLWQKLVGYNNLSFVGVTWTNEIVLSTWSSFPPHYLSFFYYNIKKKTAIRLKIQQIQGEKEVKYDGSTFVNHVANIKLMEVI